MDWKDQPEDPRAQKIIAQMEINSQADRDEIGMLRRLAGELAEIRCELRKTDARDTPITSVEMIRNLTRERDEARAEVERLRELIVALSEDERGLVTGEVHAEADRIRAALRGGGESKAHADDCPCVMCDPMQVRLDQQLRALRGGGE